ncbi:cell surface glycoprotein CD200 receptor 1 isoform X2 [Myotis yumanensis]|uniref:cell surface glycoprotein CD200 receptor 1 isoform X2 n=1 Tax=Myotis yumanensis TaxID=159337 RepID=UPI0038D021A9
MPCSWRTSDLQLLLMLTVFLVAECISASSNSTQQLVDISLPVLVDTKAVLSCPPILSTNVLITTWEIFVGDKPPCIRTHRRDPNKISKINCTDERMTWLYRPDQIPALQIDPVAITHEGYYRCTVATPIGNFHHGYQLQVLVAPEVTLFQSEHRSAVCKAVSGRPAARISWTPEGDCVPAYEYWSNGTVTVQSMCHWADGNVSIVSCSVFHETGNWSRSIELNPGAKTSKTLIILYSILPIIIVVIMGFVWLLKIIGCRKYKLKKTEPTPGVEEDEMQPYASYTEKNNPLYDTTNRVKTSQVLQNEVDGMNIHTL